MSKSRSCLVSLAAFLFVSVSALPAGADPGDCGQPQTLGADPVATDCLAVLKRAVGLETCGIFDDCVCDTDGDGKVLATDALRCLKVAVGASASLLMCDCPVTTTTSSTTTTTTTSTSTTTTLNAACPLGSPILNLLEDCSRVVYSYASPFEGVEISTDGWTVEVFITDLTRSALRSKRVVVTSSTYSEGDDTLGPASMEASIASIRRFEWQTICLGTAARSAPGARINGCFTVPGDGVISSNGQQLTLTLEPTGDSFFYAFTGTRIGTVGSRSVASSVRTAAPGETSGRTLLQVLQSWDK